MDKKRLEAIRLATPGPVARHLNKRISLPISWQLAKWGVHPNWISAFNITLGWSTGFFTAQGTYPFYLLGGFLFQMASIFDGCDGEVAKLRGMTSK
ncbi:MAG: CDP-alcohol phosphatidyltransferase family protein, partial [Deltaproteobacteria bacterium]|nr:CDP-alcohol phosphatidyltransferase family protein [Deltaproteobacteria bacterium]